MASVGESSALEHAVHRTLLAGLIVGGLLMAAGLLRVLASDQPRPEGPPPNLVTLLRLATRSDGLGLMDLGLLALMATPVLRVAVLAIGWGLARDWRFLAVALAVLGLLAISLALGVG